MATFLPFNQNPYSSVVKTSSYTVPADYYARVIVTNFETDFTIDSVIAVEATKYTANPSAAAASGVTFTNTTTYGLVGFGLAGDSASAEPTLRVVSPYTLNAAENPYSGAAQLGTGPNDALGLVVPPDCRIYTTAGTGGSITDNEYSLYAVSNPPDTEFWVPTGADLDGSRYTVELYAIP